MLKNATTTSRCFCWILCIIFLVPLSGCGWSEDDVAGTTSQEKLKRIYSETEDRNVRRAALIKIDDQDFLLNIAKRTDRDSETDLNLVAIANLSSQAHLKTFISERLNGDRFSPGMEAAIEGLHDQQMLADIVISADDENALFVLERMNDHRALEAVFTEHSNFKIRQQAFRRISNQEAITNIVLNRTSLGPASAEHILVAIDDPRLIARVVIEARGDLMRDSSVSDLRSSLVEKLNDQALLASVALKSLGQGLSERAAEKITDSAMLAEVALESDDPDARKIAIEKITDPAVMIEVAAKDYENGFFARNRFFAMKSKSEDALVAEWLPWFREDLTAELLDQPMLREIASNAADSDVRLAAVKNLSLDSETLTAVAKTDREPRVRRVAVERISDQDVLAFIAENDGYESVRIAAVKLLTSQEHLVGVFRQDGLVGTANPDFYREKYENEAVRHIALEMILDESFLSEVVADMQLPIEYRMKAARKIDDQSFLKMTAENERAAIREIAVDGITDDRFLLEIFRSENSSAVRAAIIRSLNDVRSVRDVALSAYDAADRANALQRLRTSFGDSAADIEAAHLALEQEAKALMSDADHDKLVSIVSDGELDVLVVGAATSLFDAEATERAAAQARDRTALKILLAKLHVGAQLERISQNAVDPAMRIAAVRKSGLKSWGDIFTEASMKSAPAGMLGDTLAAVSLFEDLQSDARGSVQDAALNLIRNGDESRIPEMADLLEGYGDKQLAEDYLNSGHPDLRGVADRWASRHGYSIQTGSGSARAKWGSRSP